MKKITILTMFVILAGIVISIKSAVPQNSFRMKTKGTIQLNGTNPQFIVAAPDLLINLKTNETSGQTGTINEFNPEGQYVSSGSNSQFDAIDAVLPNLWEVKADPTQNLCLNTEATEYDVAEGQSYDFRCTYRVNHELTVEPPFMNPSLTSSGIEEDEFEGHSEKDITLFTAQNLLVQYYKKQGNTTNYILVDSQQPIAILDSNKRIKFGLPVHDGEGGLFQYRVVIVEASNRDVYLAHGNFSLYYPFSGDGPKK